jgi:hypothetical protein
MMSDQTDFFTTRETVMRFFIKLLIVLLLCLIGIGFYRGWFSVSRPNPEPDGSKVSVKMSVDKKKIRSDVQKVEKKVKEEVKILEGKEKAEESR